ncbi:MAG: MotA/TolQ/ExbB proton channel family protein [Negativicutes bacterium]
MEMFSTAAAYFHKGGYVMYVLLLCSIFVVAIAAERARFFAKADAGRAFGRKFYECVTNGDYDMAQSLAQNSPGILPELLTGAFHLLLGGNRAVASFLEVQSGIALSQLRRRLYYLNVIVTLSPLLGLLGTIIGMISAFSVFNLDSGQATAITGGVGEALIATAFGLCVAILSLVVHSYFTQRIENIVTDMEQCFSIVEGRQEEIGKALKTEGGATV